ncbi:flagellar hook-associated protein FlgK [Deltaproteobacteria bacterium TL4]
MGSLNTGLLLGRSGLATQQKSLATTGHNISNVNTEGFTRQRVQHISQIPNADGTGGGVRSGATEGMFDRFTQQKIIQEKPRQAVFDTRESFFTKIEIVFNEMEGSGLRKSLNDFWDSWSLLANQPESDAARTKVRDSAEGLSVRFRQMHNELQTVRKEANGRVAGVVGEINSLSKQLAELNDQVFRYEVQGRRANDARDQRIKVLEEMSSLTNVDWFENKDGHVQVTVGDSWKIVDGEKAHLLKAIPSGGEVGMYNVFGMGDNGYKQDITQSFKGGELKEVLDIRDKSVVDYLHQLDDMAFGLAHKINRFHATGTGLNSAFREIQSSFGLNPDAQEQPLPFIKDGIFQIHLTNAKNEILETYDIEIQAGVDSIQDIIGRINQTVNDPLLLQASLQEDGSVMIQAGEGRQFIFGSDETDLSLVMGFNNFFETLQGAKDIRLSDRIVKDPNMISTGKDLVPGDNQVALEISLMQTTPTMKDDTMTFDEYYNGILADVGLRIQRNQTDKEHQDNLVSQFTEIRNSVSGVSIDEEIASMVQYQKAYEASAKFINTIDQMMDTVIKM